MIIIGIDPGKTGALAVWDRDEGALDIHDMPGTIAGVCDLIATLPKAKLVVTERLFAQGKLGTKTAFTMGHDFGAVMAALYMRGFPVRDVPPKTWKGKFGLGTDKNASRNMACQTFPNASHLFARVKDHGRAEAALLAYYGATHGV